MGPVFLDSPCRTERHCLPTMCPCLVLYIYLRNGGNSLGDETVIRGASKRAIMDRVVFGYCWSQAS